MSGQKPSGHEFDKNPSAAYLVNPRDWPAWAHVLSASELAAEPRLRSGTWLVVVYAVWSGPDLASVYVAMNALRSRAPAVQFGVHGFECPEELLKYHTWRVPPALSPVWLLVVDGSVLDVEFGVRNAGQVDRMVAGMIRRKEAKR